MSVCNFAQQWLSTRQPHGMTAVIVDRIAHICSPAMQELNR